MNENFMINLTLSKLPGAQVLTGRSGKRAIVIYLDETDGMSEKNGAVYLNLNAIKSKSSSYGDTHFIVPSTKDKPKDYRAPIIGNVRPYPQQSGSSSWKNTAPEPAAGDNTMFNEDDDLPF